ncbi:uncharacterized protein CMC5_031160 [Chondromyces crocatus]|uniref:Endonuclease/exonuclease/phosphatase domain-containing protein n=1 Tax=Chondromyces crocatus TaxID=52 RepID=A0A0K1EDN9_CHOCO|nr:uncharacterized protein CMC5_031160 [Chondromyces crocatus]
MPEAAAPAPARAPGPLRAGTFNAGLAVGVLSHAEARAEPVAHALATEPLDLLCVQEFWLEEHWQRLVESTAARLPNTYRLPPDPGGPMTCAPEDLGRLAACAAPCGGARDAARCALARCQRVLPTVSSGCLSCLGRDPRLSFAELSLGCVGDATSGQRGMQGGFFAYGGSFGTGLLTRARILERDALVFPSALARRGVLYARLDASIGEVHAFCTHLTADVGVVPHPGGGSWSEDHRREIDALLAFVERKAGRGPVILLGDLNTGPAVAPRISPRLPGHFQRLLAWGFQDPSAVSGAPGCTYCFDDPLSGGQGQRGTLIDHVLLRGLVGVTHQDLLRRPLELRVGEHVTTTGFSDHVGVVVEIAPPGG